MMILFFVIGYALGSIPFGLVLTKMAGHGDIRKIGSGNIGATNVLRTGNKFLALLTLLLDGGKGAAAVALGYAARNSLDALTHQAFWGSQLPLIMGFSALIGHMFPVWLKFRGGKGVATTLGMYLALAPPVGALACLTWLATAALFRYSSLAALIAMMAAPFYAHFIYADSTLAGLCGFIALLVWIKHRPNMKRLLKGEEPKIGRKKSS